MRRDLCGSRILITGASRGIGLAAAELLGPLGARLVVTARSGEDLDRLAGTLGVRGVEVLPVVADITSAADRERLIDRAVARFGGLDVLVNNAGVSSWGHFSTSSEAVLRRVMDVNFFAPAELIRLAVPVLTAGRQPAILNVASVCGRRGLPGFTEHSASKHALCGLTEALRGEMIRFDIDVLLVVPGLVYSDDPRRHLLRFEGRYPLDYRNATRPETVAAAIARALQRNLTETVVGWEARWMTRINRLVPGLVSRLLARKVTALYASSQAEPAAVGPRLHQPG